jgi:hypothetical protein
VSQIPVVDRLGAAIRAAVTDHKAARRRLARRRIRRLGGLAVAALLLIGGTVAAVRILDDPDQLAQNSVGCFHDGTEAGGVTITWAGDRRPVEVCADTYRRAGQPVPPLVACAWNGAVAVVPGRDEVKDCERRGMRPLPLDYARAQAKVAQLERGIRALENRADCIPPEELAADVQRLLDRTGWRGWTTAVRHDLAEVSCGMVSSMGGGWDRSISGSIDPDGHVIIVMTEPPRSRALEALLGGSGKLGQTLLDRSVARCSSVDDLRRDVQAIVAPTGRRLTIKLRGVQADALRILGDPQGSRLRDGCAIVTGVGPAPDNHGIVVEIQQKDLPER